MLTRSELEFQSIFTYIKESVLAREFSQEIQNEPLVYDTKLYNGQTRTDYKIVDPKNSAFGGLCSNIGRGFLSFELEETNPCYIYNESISGYVPTYNTDFFNKCFSLPIKRESNYITIRDQNGNIMDREWYLIDYNGCRVRYPTTTTPSGVVSSGIQPTTIDYRFHLVSLVDGWPTDEIVPKLPAVSLNQIKEEVSGYQVGPGVEFNSKYILDIFGTSNSNRRQLVNIIKQSLFNKYIPVIDFNRSGFPLKHNGVINDKFISTIEYNGDNYLTYLTLNSGNGQILYFLNIEVSYNSSPRNLMSNTMRHMAQIKFTTCSYSDRDPELVGKFSGLKEPVGGFDSLIKKSYTT